MTCLLTTLAVTISVGDGDGSDPVGGAEVHLPPGSDASYEIRVGARVFIQVHVEVAVHSPVSSLNLIQRALVRWLVQRHVGRRACVFQSPHYRTMPYNSCNHV